MHVDPFFHFITDRLELDKKDENISFKIINIIASILTNIIKDTYEHYTNNCNVQSKEKRKLIKMKNEFLYQRLLTTQNKKNYAALKKLQEGKIVPVEKSLEIKGLSIKKSNVNKNIGNYLQDILEKDILLSKKINAKRVLRRLTNLEEMIRNEFLEGKLTYSTPVKINDISSYKAPYTIGGIRGSIIYNALYPDNQIVTPAQINILKLKGKTLADIKYIYDIDKEIYQKIKSTIFDDVETVVEGKHELKPNELAKYGFAIMAFPKNFKQIPEWLIPLIDIDTVIRDSLTNILVILNSIGLKTIDTRKDELYFSNIIDF